VPGARETVTSQLRTGSGAEAGDATRGAAIKLGAECAGRLFSIATALLIARGLGVEDFGSYALLTGIAVIVAEAGEFGLGATASQALVARSVSLPVLVATRLRLTAAVVAACGLCLLLLPVIAPASWGGAAWASLLVPLVCYFLLAGWSDFLGIALRARGAPSLEALSVLSLRATVLLVALSALGAGGGLRLLAWTLPLSPLPALILAAVLLRRQRGAAAGEAGSGRRVCDVLRSAAPLALNGALALLSLRVEILALAAVRGDRDSGLFAAALKLVELLILVPAALGAGAMPALTREALAGGATVARRTVATAALLGVPAAAGLVLLAPWIVGRLFGPDYADAATPLRILAPALVPVFLNAVLFHCLIALGRGAALPRLTLVRLGVASLLAAALIPSFGPSGAAAGFLVAELTLLALVSRACRAERLEAPLASPLRTAALASVPMAAGALAARAEPLLALVVGVASYAAALAAASLLGPRLAERLAAPRSASSERRFFLRRVGGGG
jgi:O-antigen/teichoic acid export membrane protein